MLIDTPLLVVGPGPGPLVVAKVAAGLGLACLLAGHEPTSDQGAVALTAEAATVLERHGLLDVLRPYLEGADPVTLAPRTFEEVVKHHCVADLNVTVYDGMALAEPVPDGDGVRGVLTDGSGRWDVRADRLVDGASMPRDLSAAIVEGAAVAERASRTA